VAFTGVIEKSCTIWTINGGIDASMVIFVAIVRSFGRRSSFVVRRSSFVVRSVVGRRSFVVVVRWRLMAVSETTTLVWLVEWLWLWLWLW